MRSRTFGLSLAALLALMFLAGCNNTLNPLCGSARPAPLIGSLSPSTMSFAQVQQGSVLIVNGSHFVSSSEVLISAQALSTTVVSSQQLQVTLTTGVISGPGPVNVTVHTPSGNSGDLGCNSSTAVSLARPQRRRKLDFVRACVAGPETAPDLASWRGSSNTVSRALALIA